MNKMGKKASTNGYDATTQHSSAINGKGIVANGKANGKGPVANGKKSSKLNGQNSPQQPIGQKSVWKAYLLWLFGGIFGLHHLYLRRDTQAFLWWATLGNELILGAIVAIL